VLQLVLATAINARVNHRTFTLHKEGASTDVFSITAAIYPQSHPHSTHNHSELACNSYGCG